MNLTSLQGQITRAVPGNNLRRAKVKIVGLYLRASFVSLDLYSAALQFLSSFIAEAMYGNIYELEI
jgi:hypothetical protein